MPWKPANAAAPPSRVHRDDRMSPLRCCIENDGCWWVAQARFFSVWVVTRAEERLALATPDSVFTQHFKCPEPRFVMRRTWILPLVLIVECLVLGAFAPHFWDLQNILDRSRHFVEIGIVASAMTFVILSAGIDLSVGSIMGLSGTVAGFAWHYGGMSLAAACLLAGLVGVAAGGFNGRGGFGFPLSPLF